ncbi:hypothetical protein SHDE107825_11880 [Shewanella denitrificans]
MGKNNFCECYYNFDKTSLFVDFFILELKNVNFLALF